MSTERSEKIILDALPRDGTPIRYQDLEAACKVKGLGHDAFSRHLNKLKEARAIVKEAVPIKTGAGTQYRLLLPIPDLDPTEFREGWAKFIEASIKKTTEARDALSAFDAQPVDSTTTTPEFWTPYLKANEDIGRTVHSAIAALGATILSILRDYSQQDDSVIAEQYLKVAADSYIPNLIRDVARLTPPGSDFDYPAMGIAVAGLLGEDAIKESVRQMWKDMQGSNKSESEGK